MEDWCLDFIVEGIDCVVWVGLVDELCMVVLLFVEVLCIVVVVFLLVDVMVVSMLE